MNVTTSPSEQTDHIEGDREFDSVTSPKGPNKLIAGLVFGGVSVLAIAMIASNIKEEEAPKLMTDSTKEEFNDNSSASIKPYFEIPANQQKEARLERNQRKQNPEALLELQKLALEAAQKEEARMRKRLHSKIIVHDENNLTGFQSNTSHPTSQKARHEALLDKALGGLSNIGSGSVNPVGGGNQGGISSAGSSDPHTLFAQESESREFKISFAERMQDLDFTVSQGTLIDAVLETPIQSDLPGQVRAVVSESVYSMDQSRIMIPRGSRLIGQYKSQLTQGQSRIFVVWDRLIRSDGVTVKLASAGTDELGRAGVSGFYDGHFWDRFGAAIMLSVVDGILEVAIAEANKNSNNISFSSGGGVEDAASIALKNSINRRPTVYVDQGARVKVFLQRDLNFKIAEYSN